MRSPRRFPTPHLLRRHPPSPAPTRSSKASSAVNFAIVRSLPANELRLGELSDGLAKIEARQRETLDRAAQRLETSEERARAALAELGIAPSAASRIAAMGGPFFPLPKANAFDQKLAKVQETSANLEDLNALLDTVPVRFPVPRKSEITSGFGRARIRSFISWHCIPASIFAASRANWCARPPPGALPMRAFRAATA